MQYCTTRRQRVNELTYQRHIHATLRHGNSFVMDDSYADFRQVDPLNTATRQLFLYFCIFIFIFLSWNFLSLLVHQYLMMFVNPLMPGDRFTHQWLGLSLINSSPPSAAYMHHWTGSALVQVMACHLFGTKPLPEPMLTYSQWTIFSEIWIQIYNFHSRKCIWKCHLCNGGHFVWWDIS